MKSRSNSSNKAVKQMVETKTVKKIITHGKRDVTSLYRD